MVTKVASLFRRNQGIPDLSAWLRASADPDIKMERYRTGIDNKRVDVLLNPGFRKSLSSLTKKIVHEELARQGYEITAKPALQEDFDNFREAYVTQSSKALEQACAHTSVTDLVRLLHLALLSVMLEAPGLEIEEIRGKLKIEADSNSGSQQGRSLEIHRRLVSLAKHEPYIVHRTLRRLFNTVQQQESKVLRKMRKSVLGRSWMVPKSQLFNPLLHLPDLNNEQLLMNQYPLVLANRNAAAGFRQMNQALTTVLEDYLPEWAQPVENEQREERNENGFQVLEHAWRGSFSGFLEGRRLLEVCMRVDEFKQCRMSWLDDPRNIDRLFALPTDGQDDFSHRRRRKLTEQDIQAWHQFQQSVSDDLSRELLKSGALKQAIASYRIPQVYRQLKEQVPLQTIYEYLIGEISRREMNKRLNSMGKQASEEAMRVLEGAKDSISRMPADKQRSYLVRYLKDFLSFRRDLKLAYYTYQQLNHIRILNGGDEVSLSRDNGTLYEFRQVSDQNQSENAIRSHVILKADIRGSTEMTYQLIQRKLNPASHFSLNFFDPINKLLDKYGAEKVFVEGDALILTVLEYANLGRQTMPVANACGLAIKILAVMKSQNLNHDLPDLELGVGISYLDGAPAYLYDDERRIMISPAINHADRLSSCSSELRSNSGWRSSRRHCVEVMTTDQCKDIEQLLRYNVNGIELDQPAFTRLTQEMMMHKVRIQSRSGRDHYYHVGRYVDRLGGSHWLVVREARVNCLLPEGSVREAEEEKRYFYEVITDSGLIGSVKKKLRA
jgi:class 3 adenylate cyclase